MYIVQAKSVNKQTTVDQKKMDNYSFISMGKDIGRNLAKCAYLTFLSGEHKQASSKTLKKIKALR